MQRGQFATAAWSSSTKIREQTLCAFDANFKSCSSFFFQYKYGFTQQNTKCCVIGNWNENATWFLNFYTSINYSVSRVWRSSPVSLDYFPSIEQSFLHHIIKILNGLWTLWWPIHLWKRCLALLEPLVHYMRPMNLLIPHIQEVRWLHNVAESGPDHLQRAQIIALPPQSCTVVTWSASLPDASITLEVFKSGLRSFWKTTC